jgi:hypothetical protein
VCVVAALPAHAALFTFEGLADNTAVPSGFYSASRITSITGATSFIASTAGGSVPFANMPSANTAILAGATGAIFNIPGGFTSSATVLYSANGSFNAVQVFAGLDGTGTLLGSSATFVDNRSTCNAGANPGDPGCWTLATITWSGSAQSIKLPGNAGTFYYDNLTLNVTAAGVPEPSTAALVGSVLLLGIAGLRLRRAR